MDRNSHNLYNAAIYGFSGNLIHQHMDRFALIMGNKHRERGHDIETLMEMWNMFADKYTRDEITNTWALHIRLDNMFQDFSDAVRKDNPQYGKKKPVNDRRVIEQLKRKLFQ